MTDLAAVTRLRIRTGNVVTLARRDLNRFWQQLPLTDPDAARDALLDFLPALVAKYGDIASTIAADWYEHTRSTQVRGRFTALTVSGETVSAEAVGTVRFAAGHLYSDSPQLALPVLAGAVQRYVAGSSRRTITSNVRRDPARPRFARIPQGAHTCAWCSLMASRGFVYDSEQSAGDRGGAFNDFHDDCNCQVVANWSKDPAIAGYDPGRLYDIYAEARDHPELGGNDDRTIAAAMRRLHPDLFTDGVHEH